MTSTTIALANLVHKPLRSGLLIFSIAIATMTGALTLNIRSYFAASIPAPVAPRVMVLPAISATMPLAYAERMKAIPSAFDVQHQLLKYFENPHVPGGQIKLWFASEGFPSTYPPEIVAVSPEARQRWNAARSNVIVSDTLAAEMGWIVGAKINVILNEKTDERFSGDIVGLATGDLDAVIAHYEALPQTGAVSRFSIGCDAARCAQLAENVDKSFANDPGGTLSMTQDEFFESFAIGNNSLPHLFNIAAFVVGAIGAVLLLCSMLISVQERVSEVATLRALGFLRSHIVSLFVQEALLTALLGAALGAAISAILLHFDFGGLFRRITASSNISPSLAPTAAAFSIALGVSFLLACLPSVYLVRKQVGSALRG